MTIAVEQALVFSTTSADSFDSASWSPQADELLLIVVASRRTSGTPTVSGNGLTWTQVDDNTNTRTQFRLQTYRALSASTPTAGAITVDWSFNTTPIVCVALRLSGVDTSGTNGSGAIEVVESAPGPATQDNDAKVNITTLTDGAWALALGSHRGADITIDTDETAISINNAVSSGTTRTSASVWYQATDPAAAVTLGTDNDLDTNHDWAITALSIKPASTGGPVALDGSSAGQGTTAAALGYRHMLAATVAGQAATSAAAGVAVALGGSSSGLATTAATLATGTDMSATVGGLSTASGALSLLLSVSGSAHGTATGAAALAIDHALAGAGNGAATTAAAVVIALALAGSSAGSATTAASFGGGVVALAGPAAGLASTLAHLGVHTVLAGQSVAGSETGASIMVRAYRTARLQPPRQVGASRG